MDIESTLNNELIDIDMIYLHVCILRKERHIELWGGKSNSIYCCYFRNKKRLEMLLVKE